MHKLSGFFFSTIILALPLSGCGEKKFFGDVLPASKPQIVEEKGNVCDECYETYYCTCGKYKKDEDEDLCKACLL